MLADDGGDRLDPTRPLVPRAALRLRLSIGPLDPDTHVSGRTAFPDDVLPKHDLEIRVLVSSADFEVAAATDELGRGLHSVEKAFLLPADGSPATAVGDGRPWLDFALRAPAGGPARARIGYYYRDAPVQSQVLVTDLDRPHGFTITTDYTASATLHDLGAIPDTPRLSIVTNTDDSGTHGITLRPPGALAGEATAFSLPDDTIGRLVGDLRKALLYRAAEDRARRKKDLVDDLRELAPVGRQLYRQLFLQVRDVLGELRRASPRPIVHIARPRNVRFTIPWNYLYEIPLPDDIDHVAVCPLVTDWDERTPLVQGPTTACPRAADVPHTKDLLCPFGFWGFSQMVEAPASSKDPMASITVAPRAVVAVGESTKVDRQALAAHVKALRSLFETRFAGVVVEESAAKADILGLLSADLPVVYFYCHGDKDNAGSPDTYLSVGDREQIKATELIDLFDAGFAENKVIWDRVRPLVLINACHSLEISPATLVSYVDAFVGGGNAVGVIGTEVKVPQGLAMEWAEAFFAALLQPDAQAGDALRAARFHFLSSGNLFGLVYTAHCWSHLQLTGPEGATAATAAAPAGG
ncbi:MAG TPA: CHAT domain-containing protein [Acidimicrobiales bacterium]|nr:CHAT domain-containing protein [Acidimicrobiales bacterium]